MTPKYVSVTLLDSHFVQTLCFSCLLVIQIGEYRALLDSERAMRLGKGTNHTSAKDKDGSKKEKKSHKKSEMDRVHIHTYY